MKKLLIGLFTLSLLPSAFANIDTSIKDFEELMRESKIQIGAGYSIESMSRFYSKETGHGHRIIVNKLFGANNRECYLAFRNASNLDLSPCG